MKNLLKKFIQNPIIAFIIVTSLVLIGLWLLLVVGTLISIAFSGDLYEESPAIVATQVLLILVPLMFFYRMYKKELEKVHRELTVGPYILDQNEPTKNTDELNLDVKKVNEQIKEKRNKTKKLVYSSLAAAYLLFTTNAFIGVIPGWINLTLIGLLLIFSYYEYSNEHNELQKIEISLYPKDRDGLLANIQERRKNLIKSVRISLIILILINGNWLFQLNKNENERRDSVATEFQEIIGQGWCENNEMESDGAGGFYTYGGWPCITVGRVTNVRFEKADGNQQVCATVWFNRENGFPESNSYVLDFAWEEFCAPQGIEGYSIDTMKDRMYEFISPKLKSLHIELCRNYYYRLSAENQIRYCYFSN